MTLQVDIVQLGEDNFYILLFNHIVQCACCPACICFPVFMHAVHNQLFVAAAQNGEWRYRTNISNYIMIQGFWMEPFINTQYNTGRYPHTQGVTVFAQAQNTHVAVCFYYHVMIYSIFDDIFYKHTFWQDCQRFGIVFGFVQSHSVINAIFVFQNQCRTTNQTTGIQHGKLFCTFRSCCPFCMINRCNRSKCQVKWHCAQAMFPFR